MKNSKLLCQLFFFTSISFSQIVDVFVPSVAPTALLASFLQFCVCFAWDASIHYQTQAHGLYLKDLLCFSHISFFLLFLVVVSPSLSSTVLVDMGGAGSQHSVPALLGALGPAMPFPCRRGWGLVISQGTGCRRNRFNLVCLPVFFLCLPQSSLE